MRKVWIALLLAACGDDGGEPKEPIVGDATATVTHYDYRFDLQTRQAHSKLDLTFTSKGDCVTLPVRAESFDLATGLVDDGPPTRFELANGKLVACGEGREAGATMTIETDQVVALATIEDSQVGYSVRTDNTAAKNPLSYLVSWVGGCDRFGPCDSRPDQFATYTFHVTHPADQMVRCSGAITEETLTDTRCDFTAMGGPTYSTFGFVAYPRSAWTSTDLGTWGAHAKVTMLDRTDTGETMALDKTYHQGFVAFMEQNFGPYPFGDELRILVAPTYWAGFEHPGNIVLDDGLKKQIGSAYSNVLAHTLDHEMAHQWAGDQTTIKDTYDFTWKEAMAEYLAYVYEDEHAPSGTGLTTAQAWKTFSAGAAYYPVPGEKPALFDYYSDVYGQGPMVLFRQLEALTSRAQVLDALKSVLGQQRALSVDELMAALSAKTGLDLTAYTAAWVKGTGSPTIPLVDVEVTATSAHVVQKTATNRLCKFHVRLHGTQPTEMFDFAVDTFRDGIDQTITIAPAFTVATIEVDPLRECLVGQFAARAKTATRMSPWLSSAAAKSSN